MTPPRLLLCFATAKGAGAMEALRGRTRLAPPVVCTFREKDTEGDSHLDILRTAAELGCATAEWKEFAEAPEAFLGSHGITGIVAIGWRYMIPMRVAPALPHGILVFHDALLPRHRGFAPLATAILCGDAEAGVTLLHAAEEVDAGDVVLQKCMPLHDRMTIAEAIEAVTPLYRDALAELLDALESGKELPRTPQRHEDATFSIWRSPEDGRIDWSRSATTIDRVVRSAGAPYSGAFTTLSGRKLVVRRTTPQPDVRFDIRDAGKVWRLCEGRPVVVCGEGMLRIDEAEWESGESALPMNALRVRLGI